MANLRLDLSQDYATQMLSFYLYGKEAGGKVPAPNEIADSKWIRNETMTVDINAVDFMEKTGLKDFNPYEFGMIRRFFKNEHEANTELLPELFHKGNDTILKAKINELNQLPENKDNSIIVDNNNDGTYSLNYQAFRYFFYEEGSNNFNISKEPKADYFFYHDEVLNQANLNKNAFVFGSTKLTFNTDKIRFVVDSDGKPIRIDDFIVEPSTKQVENFDYEGGTGAAQAVNHLLRQLTDPSGIGKAVNFNYDHISDLSKNSKSVVLNTELLNQDYSRNKSAELGATALRALGFLQEYERIKATGVISYLDEQNRVVIFDGSNTNVLTGTEAKNLNLEDPISLVSEEMFYQALGQVTAATILSPALVTAISMVAASHSMAAAYQLNHYREYLKNGITYVSGNGQNNISGTDKSDYLIGGNENDILSGGRGVDHMEGGLGFDTYYVKGQDTIVDADMDGTILFKHFKLPTDVDPDFGHQGLSEINVTLPETFKTVSKNMIWQDEEKTFTAIRINQNDLQIQQSQSGNQVTIKNFFHLATATPEGGLTALNFSLDQATAASHQNTRFAAGIQNRYNTFYANDAKNTFIKGAGLDDLLFGAASSGIEAQMGQGNDRVFGSFYADVIYGEEGNDVLNGSNFVPANTSKPKAELDKDADLIIGGAGRDLINGMAGDDIIHTGEEGEYLNPQATGERGDWALGHLGNDYIYGSRGEDFLQGGEGSDVVHGGAGDDVVLGDSFIRFGTQGKNVSGTPPSATVETVPLPGGWAGTTLGVVNLPGTAIGVTHTLSATDKDGAPETTPEYAASATHPKTDEWSVTIDRENGDYSVNTAVALNNNQHRVAIGGDSDFLYGGAGDDLIIGQDGNDYVSGGSGNDILFGDDNRDGSVSGNDFLLAGTGSDRLYGGPGFDIYQFESQDLLQGDMNIVEDSDNQGAVILDGLALGDLGWTASNINGFWLNEDKGLSLHLQNGTLLVSGDGFGGKIFIQNFVDGALGIKLPESDNTDPNGTNSGNEKITAIVTGEGSGAFETESGSGSIEAGSYSYDDGGMGYWKQWGENSGAFGD